MFRDAIENKRLEKLVSLNRAEQYYNDALAIDFDAILSHLTSPYQVAGGVMIKEILENEFAKACIKDMYLLQPEFRVRWELANGPLNVVKIEKSAGSNVN